MKYRKETIIESDILKGHNLSEVARKTGISLSYLSLLQNNKRTASFEVYQKLERVLTNGQYQ